MDEISNAERLLKLINKDPEITAKLLGEIANQGQGGNMFRINEDANIDGTHYQTSVVIPPRDLVDLLGPYLEGDGKISGQYILETKSGSVVSIYEYKSTSLYDPMNPDPKVFWDSDKPYRFHIGAHSENVASLCKEFVERRQKTL